MTYQETLLTGSGKEIIQRVLSASRSQVLIPPKLKDQELIIADQPEDGKYIGLFSSGSTGKPKCIWNKEERLLLNGRLSAKAFEIHSHHFLVMMAAPWHVAGFTWALMAEQLDCEYLFITTKRGDQDVWLKTIQDTTPDYLMTIPSVLRALYGEKWFATNVVYGGYAIEMDEFEKLSPHCKFTYQGYGQTEAGGLISSFKRQSSSTPFKNENQCCGKAVEGAQLQCVGTWQHPKSIYLESPTSYCESSYDTGDEGYFDKNGNIYLATDKERATNSSRKAVSK